MKIKADDPVALGNRGSWPQLIGLGMDAWNRWAQETLETPENGFKIGIGADQLNNVDFSGFIFPDNTIIDSRSQNTQVNFEKAVFLGRSTFRLGKANNRVSFKEARFEGDVNFSGSHFAKSANFSFAAFLENAEFTDTTFELSANFENTKFVGDLNFVDSCFKITANFDSCRFDGDVSFERSIFHALPIFSNTVFSQSIPNLRAAHFAPQYPPDFHKAEINYPTKEAKSFWDRFRKICDTPDGAERARILKKLAADGHNHDEEIRFFAMEMKAKRKHEIPYDRVVNWPKLFINHTYELFSDFGQSTLRPLFFLTVILAWSAYCYAGILHNSFSSRISAILDFDPVVLTASFSSLLPFAGQALIGRKVIESGLCGQLDPSSIEYTDCLALIYRISAVEGFLAFIFLFLLGLALRNIARIK